MGSCLNTLKSTVGGNTCTDETRRGGEGVGQGGEQQDKETRENCSATWPTISFYGNWVTFQVVSAQSFSLRVFSGGMHIPEPRWIPLRRILGDW